MEDIEKAKRELQDAIMTAEHHESSLVSINWETAKTIINIIDSQRAMIDELEAEIGLMRAGVL